MPYLTPYQDLTEFCSCGRPIGLVVDPNGNAWRACKTLWAEIETGDTALDVDSPSNVEGE